MSAVGWMLMVGLDERDYREQFPRDGSLPDFRYQESDKLLRKSRLRPEPSPLPLPSSDGTSPPWELSLDRRQRPVVVATHRQREGNLADVPAHELEAGVELLLRTMAELGLLPGQQLPPASATSPPASPHPISSSPLVIHVNEGEVSTPSSAPPFERPNRNCPNIHLKANAQPQPYLHQLLASSPGTTNPAQILPEQHFHDMTANHLQYYSMPGLASYVINTPHPHPLPPQPLPEHLFFRLPEAWQPADHPELVWYGSRVSPRLVATLRGRTLNGLSLGEVLRCMQAFVAGPFVMHPRRGMSWALVPAFAAEAPAPAPALAPSTPTKEEEDGASGSSGL